MDNVFSFSLSQSDHIKQLPLYNIVQIWRKNLVAKKIKKSTKIICRKTETKVLSAKNKRIMKAEQLCLSWSKAFKFKYVSAEI